MPNQTLFEQVTQQFNTLGWQPGQAPTVAQRYFETAVGPKHAYVMLSPSGRLLASYTSEGRNVVEALWHTSLQEAVEQGLLAQVIAKFEGQARRDIDESFARRLWLKFSAPAPALAP